MNKIQKLGLSISAGIAGFLLPLISHGATSLTAIVASADDVLDQSGAIFFNVLLTNGLTVLKWLLPVGLALLVYHYFRGKSKGRM